MANKIAFKGKG